MDKVIWKLTEGWFVFGYRGIGSDSLVLSVNKDPQPDLAIQVVEMARNTVLESSVGLGLENTEAWQIRWRPVLLVKGGKVEAFMARESIVCDNLCAER
jgi:hypothetical protein